MIRSKLWYVANLFLLGAIADGNEECFGIREIDASIKGNFSSPMYGKSPHYPDDLSCEYQIKAPIGHQIKLTFKDFDVDVSQGCKQDQLAIFGKNNRVLGTFCGQGLPRPVLARHNEVRLSFETDLMQGGRGFLIEYESGPDLQLCDSGFEACRNRNCYDPEKECDGVDDCGDGTDEEGCRHVIVVNPKDCGIPAINPRFGLGADRMVGGEEVIPNSWPWQVSLQRAHIEPNGHFCGGTLINTIWVLTATHCVVGKDKPGRIKVVIGAHGKFTTTPYQQVRYSARVVSYPELLGDDIKNYNIVNDMSLIRLNAAVILNQGVHPVCLPNFGYNPKPGTQCYATGWGETRGSGSSDALKQTLQIVKTQQQCKVRDQSTQVCVGNTGLSACHGDSGGPLQCKVNNKWYLMGAASYVTKSDLNGKGLCAGPNANTVYSATALKLEWIKKMIRKYSKLD